MINNSFRDLILRALQVHRLSVNPRMSVTRRGDRPPVIAEESCRRELPEPLPSAGSRGGFVVWTSRHFCGRALQ